MDLDIKKPLYAFVIDIFNGDKLPSKGDIPGDFIQKCLSGKSSGKGIPAIALRGSTSHFGAWDVPGVDATEVSKGMLLWPGFTTILTQESLLKCTFSHEIWAEVLYKEYNTIGNDKDSK